VTSAYPKRIAELVPQAQLLARELGEIPSQNRLKAALHVRAERAKEVLRVLNETGFDPTGPEPDTDEPDLVPQVRPEPGPAEFQPDQSAPVNGTGEPDPSGSLKPSHNRQTQDSWRPASAHTGTTDREPLPAARPVSRWPVIFLAAPAFVAIWSAWVGVGELAGFGPVRPLPGIADGFTINSAITLPIGMETYAAYALRVWLSDASPARARSFAKRSAISAFVLGGLGQIAYHLMTAAEMKAAPWLITAMVSCLPVVVLGFGAALMHLQQPQRVGTEDTR
jgi:hypothetical protein